MTTVRILRVLGINAKVAAREATVIAIVDDNLVKFSIRDGWTCACDTDTDQCPHVDDLADLLDPRVIAEAPL